MISTRAITRVILAAFVLSTGLALAGCEDTKLMEMFDGKKKLPGERREVFPGGQVPGVQAGVPPELVKGYQPPVDPAAAPPQSEGAPAAQAQPEPEKPAPPPKPKRVAKPKPKPQPVAAAPVQQQQPAQQPPQQQQPQQDSAPQPQYKQPRAWPGATPSGPPTDRFSR